MINEIYICIISIYWNIKKNIICNTRGAGDLNL